MTLNVNQGHWKCCYSTNHASLLTSGL